ncbi:MAG: CHAP domain-containing protein [Patescibacteria group bacterium]
MRIAALVSLFALAMLATSSSTVSAEMPDFLQVNKAIVEATQPTVLAALDTTPSTPVTTLPPTEIVPILPPEEKYKVAENDSLSTIAEKHSTTWKRLYDKNEVLQNPDTIKVGEELTVPRPEEVLKDRPLPVLPQETVAKPQVVATTTARNNGPAAKPKTPKPIAQPSVQTRGASTGNTYSPGYCTWYAKNKRPDMPNNLGNADTWVARAAAQGLPTGSSPRAGAIGQQGMHVVYVESVNGDNTVTISEMNYNGLYVISRRTVPASTFAYIY